MTSIVTILVVDLLLICGALWAIRSGLRGSRPSRTSATWGCGYVAPSGRMQYTAASFGAPVVHAFSAAAVTSTDSRRLSFGTNRGDRVLQGIAVPVWERLKGLAFRLRPLQQGRVTTYLQYIILTFLVLLGYLFFTGLARHR